MSETHDTDDAAKAEAAAAFARAERASMFGPSFFLGQLGRFVRDHCPSPGEHLPMVQIRLADGQTLDPCHIVGVSAHWVVLAVRDAAGRQEDMAIELVPFELVRGVRICARHAAGSTVGFLQHHAPAIIGAETLLEATLSSSHEHV
jgi:hypothetical protein